MLTADNYRYLQGLNAPNFAPGAFGNEAAAANDFYAVESTSVAERPKPQIPPKKLGLGEMLRFREKLDNMRYEKERAEELKSMMEDDLIEAQEEAERRDAELAKTKADLRGSAQALTQMKERAQSLAREVQDNQRTISDLKESIQAQEILAASQDDALEKQAQINALEAQVRELLASLTKERILKEVARTSLDEGHAQAFSELEGQIAPLQPNIDAKDVEIRMKVASATEHVYGKGEGISQDKQTGWEAKPKEEEYLTAEIAKEHEKSTNAVVALASSENEVNWNTNEVRRPRTEAESKLQTTVDEYFAKVAAIEQHHDVQMASLVKRTEDAEAVAASLQTQSASLQQQLTSEQLAFVEAQLDSQMQVEVDGEQIAKLQQESDQRRQRLEFFRRNSEHLSRRIKDTEARNRALEQSEGLKSRQVEDLRREMARVSEGGRREMLPVHGGFA
ncbi:MAG: hypothetical protein M1822_002428 [Bathelium mastoideum]|nr:MAG: hypothetical protein M1822_002428 [Bathelium mastoideum]